AVESLRGPPMRILRFAALFALSLPLAAQPYVGAEHLLVPYGASAPRTALKYRGDIAGNANGFFVAWTEFTDQYRAIGAFLSRDAQPIGSPMVVSTGWLIDVQPAGDRYVVATTTKTLEVTPSGSTEVLPRAEEEVLNASGEHL